MPTVGAILDPAKHLKGHKLHAFMNIESEITIAREQLCKRPRACHMVSVDDEVQLAKILLDRGLALLLPEDCVLRDAKGDAVTAGFFAVPQKAETDRIITDRRPQNWTESRLSWAELPQGCLLTQLIPKDGESVRGSGDDISNYFHLLKHRRAWVYRNAVGRRLPGEKFVEMGLDVVSVII